MHGNYSFNYAGGIILFKPLNELFCTLHRSVFTIFKHCQLPLYAFMWKTILIIQCMKINIWLSTLFHFLFCFVYFSLRTVQEKINSLLLRCTLLEKSRTLVKRTKWQSLLTILKYLNSSENVFVWWNVFVKWC